MEDTNPKTSTQATDKTRIIQPRLLLQALIFTGILYFSMGKTPPPPTEEIVQSLQTNTTLAATVRNSVLQHTSKQSGLPKTDLHIVQTQAQIWSDNCLGLRDAKIACTKMTVPGWQVAVVSGQKRWLYRTNASGTILKLEYTTAASQHKSFPPPISKNNSTPSQK